MPEFQTNDYFSPLLKSNHHQKTTHLAIVAHQDDAEIIGYSGIHRCYQSSEQWFSCITLTNGSGASRGGKYQNISDHELSVIRQSEQIKAAQLGEYAYCQQWLCNSKELKTHQTHAINQLANTIAITRPDTVYTHNPFDKHATHITVMNIALQAIKQVQNNDPTYTPKVYGVEVWGSLDWLPELYRIDLDCSPMPNLEQALIGLYDSQIDGNKGYDTAVLGRRLSNATFHSSHSEDTLRSSNIALDLSLVANGTLSLKSYSQEILDVFINEKKSILSSAAPSPIIG